MSAAFRTFSSSLLLTSASLLFISALSVLSSMRYLVRSSLRPTHAPTGPDTAATSADTMIVIISPLIHCSNALSAALGIAGASSALLSLARQFILLLFNTHFCEPFFYIEAGARFISKFVMTVNSSAGVFLEKFFNQLYKRSLLCRGSCVLPDILPIRGLTWRTSANVTHTD